MSKNNSKLHRRGIAERAARADVPKALRILRRAGVRRPPVKGDEVPARRGKQR